MANVRIEIGDYFCLKTDKRHKFSAIYKILQVQERVVPEDRVYITASIVYPLALTFNFKGNNAFSLDLRLKDLIILGHSKTDKILRILYG